VAQQPANIGLLPAPRQGAAQWVLQCAVTKQASSACEIYCRSSRRREQALCSKIGRRGDGAALREAPNSLSRRQLTHCAKEYARGDVMTKNTVEGYFGVFKRCIVGVYQRCAYNTFRGIWMNSASFGTTALGWRLRIHSAPYWQSVAPKASV
jgi:hypothetical protein